MNEEMYRYPLKKAIFDIEIEMPKCAKVVSCLFYKDAINIFVSVDIRREVSTRTFTVIPTGEKLNHKIENLKHLASIEMPDGSGVHHVFEVLV